ncbi:unnamed protein product [Paramecium sonneborni]|uniref:Uncharacterized protein n=1 Tax=Paramecium sonneborni TaxID=65129 RepID=A0A8S1L6R5_9CILI|nr:unnamed protein product [Paramecium sonneborni]
MISNFTQEQLKMHLQINRKIKNAILKPQAEMSGSIVDILFSLRNTI